MPLSEKLKKKKNYNKEYRINKRSQYNASILKHYHNNKEAWIKRMLEWQKKNAEWVREYSSEFRKEDRINNPLKYYKIYIKKKLKKNNPILFERVKDDFDKYFKGYLKRQRAKARKNGEVFKY